MASVNLRKCFFFCSLLVVTGCVAGAPRESERRVEFARGQSSTKIEGSVIRGTRDRYVIGAKVGEVMTVNISSSEKNAVFSVARPDGKFLPGASDESDATHWSGKLPATGDFVIEVGGTRGNAKYVLSVAVK